MPEEQLKRDVEALAAPEGRLPGSPGHAAAREHLLRRMETLGLAPYAGGQDYCLPYEANGSALTNVLGELPGADPAKAPLLIAAHYDTCGPQPGADDNAAAIAIALAAAERLREAPLDRSVVFAFFDAEEPPYYLTHAMGSIHFYYHQQRGPVHCALVMDLMGHDVPVGGLEDVVFVTGMESDPGLASVMEGVERPAGLRIVPTLNRYIGDQSDYHVFRVNEQPYLFLSCGRWPHYHQATDTPEKLSYRKMAAAVPYLTALARRAAATPLEGPFEGYDSTPVELVFLREAIGPMAASFGLRLERREDIDALARVLMAQFGL